MFRRLGALAAIAIVLSLSSSALAESIRTSGRFGLGLGSGTLANGLSAKYFMADSIALQANLDWMGGLSLGGGEIIGRRPLEEVGGVARNIVKALSMSAAELCQGRPVPQESVERMALPLAPKWLFIRVGNRGWKKQARGLGTEGELNARPYK